MRIGIVGAGIAGLTAAHDLIKKGHQVTIFESANYVGGLAAGFKESHWDWSQGEPPMDNPDYYLRYNKSFNRMGGQMRYVTADNRDFLLTLVKTLEERK